MVGERIRSFVTERANALSENISDLVNLAVRKGSVGEFVGSFLPIPVTETGERMADRRARARRKLIS